MTCLLSFDIEDWFHAHNLRPAVDRDEWEACESRVEQNTTLILDLLSKHDAQATFFVLGWVAERHPHLIQKIVDEGHELASHGYNHELIYQQTHEEVRRDIVRSVEILQSIASVPIRGYRAPSFSITDWATDILRDLDFQYDSSSFAVAGHDRYGGHEFSEMKSSNTFGWLDNDLIEARLPQVNLPFVPAKIPWAGGGYFRFIPYPIYKRGVERIASRRPFIFYLHPWDLDPDQPYRSSLPLSYRLRHYTNLDRTVSRLDSLLADFDWRPIGTYLRRNSEIESRH